MKLLVSMVCALTVLASSPARPARWDEIPTASAFVTTGQPVLAPPPFVRFCIINRTDCRAGPPFAWHRAFTPTRIQYTDLHTVNRTINQSIEYRYIYKSALTEQWGISYDRGACADYAVTKRHELMQRGWPARALLLAEVIAGDGTHHLVLVAHTSSGDFVLDSMTPLIIPSRRAYRAWIRIQSPTDPWLWYTAGNS